MSEYNYKGQRIIKDQFRFRITTMPAWGDQPGEDLHSFKTLTAAKSFIDRMEASGQLGKPNTPAPADYTQPTLTMSDYLDFYRAFTHITDDPAEVAAMDDDELAEQVADLIGDCYAAGNFPRDMEDGCIDLYGIAAGIKAAARELIQQQEVTA